MTDVTSLPMTNTPSVGPSLLPTFNEIPEPRMVALHNGNASGSKPFQSLLDGHPEILMIPAYPLMYFYPHWEQWREEMRDLWTWPKLIDRFCVQHASVIDSTAIPGHDGLTTLGENRNDSIQLNKSDFQRFLAHFVEDRAVDSRTFLLAIHYAYALCRDEDLFQKKVIVYHIHIPLYVPDYLLGDFPDLLTIGLVRDPRSNIYGRYRHSYGAAERKKLNASDAAIYERRTYHTVCRHIFVGLEHLKLLDKESVRVVRMEDLVLQPKKLMRAVTDFLGISFDPSVLTLTFGGKKWWGTEIYNMKPMNQINPRVVSKDWQQHINRRDQYVIEGLFFNYMEQYGYPPELYVSNGFWPRLRLIFLSLLPSSFETRWFLEFLQPVSFRQFLDACRREASGETALKDYQFHAFYRHRWNIKVLRLWKSRWYLKFLIATRGNGTPETAGPHRRLLGMIGRWVYIASNITRYLWTVVSYPLTVTSRWPTTLGALTRQFRKSDVLPQSFLPAHGTNDSRPT